MGPATVRQCVVLVGGGRLAAPLAWQLRELSRFGVEDVVLLGAPQAAALIAPVQQRLPKPLRIAVAPGDARGLLAERFLLCGGDGLFTGNLARLLAAAARDPPEVIGRIVRAPGGDASIIRLDRRVLDLLGPNRALGTDTAAVLAARNALRETALAEAFSAAHALAAGPPRSARRLARPALFLDRDGVINLDHGWVGTRERFAWMPGIIEAIRDASDAGWHVFVVTNQSGVARGHYTEADVVALEDWMEEELRRAGGTIDDWRYCPFHPEAAVPRYRQASDWRKPGPGMLLDLIRRWELDPARCALVGDQPTDLAAAAAAGMTARLFRGHDIAGCIAAARADIMPPSE